MNKINYIVSLIIVGLLSCGLDQSESGPDLPVDNVEELVLFTSSGDTLPTGKAIILDGETIEQGALAPPKRIPLQTKVLPSDPDNTFSFRRSKSVPWPEALPIYTIGEDGIPLPEEITYSSEKLFTPSFKDYEVDDFRIRDLINNGFQYWDIEQGLPTSFIRDVVEDDQGYFWIASNLGLIRYDGINFRLYNFSPIEDHREVYGIMEDSAGNLWLNHGPHMAFSRFDGQELHFYKFDKKLVDPYNWISTLKEDKDGNIWLPTSQGLILYNETKPQIYDKRHGLLDSEVIGVEEGINGTLWVFSNSGINLLDNGNISHLSLNASWSLSDGNKGSYFQKDSAGNIWFFVGELLCSFSGKEIVYYESEKFQTNSNGLVIPGSENQLWVSSVTKELLCLNLEKMEGEALPINFGTLPLKVSLFDSFGRVWSVTEGQGFNRYDDGVVKHFLFRGVLDFPNASAVYQASNGVYWIGFHGDGLLKYANNQFVSIPAFNGMVIRTIKEDHAGNMWIGAQEAGVYKITDTEVVHYDSNVLSQCSSLQPDYAGKVWVGTPVDGVFSITDSTYHKVKLSTTSGGQINFIRSFLKDSKGNLWTATYGGGLRKFDGTFTTIYTKKEGLCGNRITSIMEDDSGLIWIGSQDGGLSVFDGEKFENFSTEAGLSNKSVWIITEDAKGRIWVGADACWNALKVNKTDETLPFFEGKPAIYCDLDGISGGEFYANASIIDEDGVLWWGTNKSLASVNPDELIFEEKSKVTLRDLEILETSIDFRLLKIRKDSGGHQWIKGVDNLDLVSLDFDSVSKFNNYPINLKVPYNLSSISFYFSSTNFPDLTKIKYSYFVEGIDKTWSIPRLEASATYRNIPPGRYTLKVKSAGNENIWSEIFEYDFEIKPPWWQTIWAYLLWFCLISGLIYSLYKSNLKRQFIKQESVRLKELEAFKAKLYTNITHEFRTPLTVMLGMSEQLAENSFGSGFTEKKKADFRNGLNLIQRNGQSLLRLINQLLDLAKLDAGELKVNYLNGDIISYLQYLTESFYSMAMDKNVRLTFYSEVESLNMDFDEEKIQHIIYNLLSNAVKFTPEKGKVILHARKINNGGADFLQIKVKDTGIGIPSEKVEHIFDRFYQVDGTSTRRGEGTGIGLALTKDLVDLMDARIEIESEINKGTTISVWFSITQSAPVSILENKLSKAEPFIAVEKENLIDQVETLSDNPLLLVVEDNPDVTTYIKKVLENDYQIISAEDGLKGIEAATENIPDVIISDVMMPGMNGFEVCKNLKADKRTSHIPIVMLTAKATQEDRIEGLKFGADAFLTKPFNKAELLIRLEKLVQLRKDLKSRYSNFLETPVVDAPEDNLEETFLIGLKDVIFKHLSDSGFGVPQLAKEIAMSQMQVYRKLKALTGKTPSQYIRSIRLHQGLALLQSTDLTVSEIAYQTGFSDPNYFSRTFQKEFKKSPSDIRK